MRCGGSIRCLGFKEWDKLARFWKVRVERVRDARYVDEEA